VRFRNVMGSDVPLIYEWRNDVGTRKTTSEPHRRVLWPEQLAWFKRVYQDGMWWLAHEEEPDIGNIPVGHVRFHVSFNKQYPKDWSAVANVTVGPQFRGCGFGTKIIRYGTEKIWRSTDAFRCLAFVKPDNEASTRAFAKVGYNVVDDWRGQLVMEIRRQDHEPTSKDLWPS
jgi:UDP-2,4-diacetamido-2,4,6-trideoxy-beta-L-altropyranose hydrolase